MRLYGSLTKIDVEQRIVAGYASTEAVDAHGEIVLKSAIEAALDDYLEFANVREMQQLSAVGVTEEAAVDDRGLYIAARTPTTSPGARSSPGRTRASASGEKLSPAIRTTKRSSPRSC